jgi:hypothetical protein
MTTDRPCHDFYTETDADGEIDLFTTCGEPWDVDEDGDPIWECTAFLDWVTCPKCLEAIARALDPGVKTTPS